MEYNCSYLFGIQAPDVYQQMEALGTFGLTVSIAGAVSTVFLIVLFIINVFRIVDKNAISRRRLLVWITSLPMIVSCLALVAFVVPRAGLLCDIVKQGYMPFLLVHFIDLSVMIQGGQSETLAEFVASDTHVRLCTPFCCCIQLCFRNVKTYNKKTLRVIKGLVYQMPLSQLVCIAFVAILESAGVLRRQIFADYVYLVFMIIYVTLFLIGMWAFNVLAMAFYRHSKWPRYLLKARFLGFSIMVLKCQWAVIVACEVLGNSIPCVPPFVSTYSMRRTIEATVTLVEAFIIGIIFFLLYRHPTSSTNDIGNLVETPPSTPDPEYVPAYYINFGAEVESRISSAKQLEQMRDSIKSTLVEKL